MAMQEKGKLIFPDFNLAVCSENLRTLSEAEDTYRQMLLATGTDYNVLYSNKLLEMQNMLKRRNLSPVKKDLEDLIRHLTAYKKKVGYDFPIFFEKRKKSDVKCHNKIRLFLTEQYIYDKDVTLDSIQDTLGIRIMPSFGNVDTMESLKTIYEILDETINFFTLKKGYNPRKKGNMFDLNFNSKEHPEVLVPKNSDDWLKPTYSIYVKDYYAHPKSDGYQSLHIVFDGPSPIEVQIRTFATHLRVETLHDGYDSQRYDGIEFDRVYLDREHVNIHGYGYVNGKVQDKVGLETAIDPYNQLY